jgi:hypothetical protein
MKKTIAIALLVLSTSLNALDVIPSVKVLNEQYNTISEHKLQQSNQELYTAIRDRIIEAYSQEEESLTLEFFSNENNHIFYFPDVIKVNQTLIDLLKRHLQNKGYAVEKTIVDNETTLTIYFKKK